MLFINANYNIIHKMTREHIFVQTMLKLADKNSILGYPIINCNMAFCANTVSISIRYMMIFLINVGLF